MAAAVLAAGVATAAPFELPTKSAATIEKLVPATWQIEEDVAGDLDGDGVDDHVVVLSREEKTDPDGERVLLVVLKRSDGFAVVGTNRGLLICKQCGGVKGGGPPDIQIAKRVIAISQLSGSRESSSSTHRFRLDTKSKRVELIGLDQGHGDSITTEGGSTSTNYLTGRWTSEETTLVKPDCDPAEGECKTSRKKGAGKSPKQPLVRLEDVKPPDL